MAIIIALMTLVFAGFAAFVVDVGALYEERRDLQNGADAAALAVAQACALNEISCPDSGAAQPIAEQFADLNANDLAARALESEITWDGNEVTVITRTDDAGPNSDGDTNTLDHWFARIWGNGGTEVSAEASAFWGTPSGLSALPIIISSCEWSEATADPAIPGSPTPPLFLDAVFGVQTIIRLKTFNGNGEPQSDPSDCDFGPGQDIDGNGGRAEGGFGYLENNDCEAYVTADGYVQGQTGNGNPENVLGCNVADILGHVILIPMFDDADFDVTPPGCSNGQPCYHVFGFGAFLVDGVDFGQANNSPWNNNPTNFCGPNENCLRGSFQEFVDLDTALTVIGGGGEPNLGVVIVGLSG